MYNQRAKMYGKKVYKIQKKMKKLKMSKPEILVYIVFTLDNKKNGIRLQLLNKEITTQ